MPSFNLTNFDAAMKHMYPYKKVENMVYKNNPLLAMIPKSTKFPGRNATYAVEYGVTNGRSANFQTAQNNRNGTKLSDFVVTRVKDYAVVSVDNETLLAADGNEGSLLDVAKSKTDSALLALSRSMGSDIYRSGSGSIGQLDDSVADDGLTLTLTQSADAANFEVGMRIVAGTATEGDTLANNGTAIEVVGIDRDAGTLTLGSPMEAAWSIASGDNADLHLYCEGDAQNGTGNSKLKISGIDAWIPSAVTSTSFFGVDRTVDATRLGGQRQSATGGDVSISEDIINAAVKTSREGGRPDACFMNPTNWAALAIDLEGRATVAGSANRRRYDPKDKVGTFGFSSLSIATPTGMVDIYADHNCPINVAYLLQLDTWEFKSLGAAPRILDFDGLKGLRQANEDGVEYRWGYYGNLLCKAPGFNCRIALA